MKVFIIAALTADGFIGKDSSHLADWTSPEDKKSFVRLTKEAGTMVMGSRTFNTIGKALPGRRTIVYSMQNRKYDGVEVTDEPPARLIERLKKEGATGLAICGGASIYQLFLEAGVVDELYLTIEPLLFGQGIGLLASATEQQLELLDLDKINQNSYLAHYKVIR